MGIIGGPPIGGVGSIPGRGGPPELLKTANIKWSINVETAYHAQDLSQIYRPRSELYSY